ncbi:MAG: FecR domain-containing protein [Oleiphilaceae bacterium]|nr:FecR domain-containing protein [Oleiphilaceae bacterium]
MSDRSRQANHQAGGEGDAIEVAAGWMARLLADDATEQDLADCRRWRERHAANERAWQRMCQVTGKFAAVPPGAGGTQVLEKARRADLSRRRFLKLGALAGISVSATWLATTRSPYGRALMAQYRTGVGESQTFTLDDGTRLTLNTDSAVDATFTNRERRIELHQGEILIETGPESPRRDFVVNTPFGQLEALGTRFNVRLYESHAMVAVLEGAVQALAAGGGLPQRVDAGQQVRLNRTLAGAPEALPPAAISWREGKLVARGMRLAEFVAEIGRYRTGFTVCDDAVADLTISGVFSVEDTGRALQSLTDSLPVALDYRTAYWVKVVPAR